MTPHSVDYNSLVDWYDQGRAISHTNKEIWLNLLTQHLGLSKNHRVLDIGCGTGRFAILISRQFQCSVVGIDPALSMLKKAKGKCPTDEIEWTGGQAEMIPFADGVFDLCFASQVIHHFQNPHLAFGEMYRVLKHGGQLGIRYSSHAQLSTILDYHLFPSALLIDLERIPDIQIVRSLLQTAGFYTIEEYTVSQQLFDSVDVYLGKLRKKYASVLSLIPEQEYHKGLARAVAYFENGEFKPSDRFAEITFLIGIK